MPQLFFIYRLLLPINLATDEKFCLQVAATDKLATDNKFYLQVAATDKLATDKKFYLQVAATDKLATDKTEQQNMCIIKLYS